CKLCVSMAATRPLFGFAAQTKRPLNTGRRKLLSISFSGGNPGAPALGPGITGFAPFPPTGSPGPGAPPARAASSEVDTEQPTQPERTASAHHAGVDALRRDFLATHMLHADA